MFGKEKSKLEVVIGAASRISGTIVSKGTVRVDGTHEGDIAADQVIVGEAGSVRGNLVAKSVIAAGKVTGDIRAESNVEIQAKGTMIGDIYTPKLLIAEGAIFEGRSVMQAVQEGTETRLLTAENQS